MTKHLLFNSLVRFDKLFEHWDRKNTYSRKNSKYPIRVDYYLMTETSPALPVEEQSPHVAILESQNGLLMTIYRRYYTNGIIYSGIVISDFIILSDQSIREILQINIDALDVMIYRRVLKRLEFRLGNIDSDTKLSDEEKVTEKATLSQDINGFKQVLNIWRSK